MTVTIIEDNKKDTIKERHLKHIAEISQNLKPIKLEKLTQDQEHFLNRTSRYAPYRPEPKTRVRDEEDEDQW